jgi:hypothetical protein
MPGNAQAADSRLAAAMDLKPTGRMAGGSIQNSQVVERCILRCQAAASKAQMFAPQHDLWMRL